MDNSLAQLVFEYSSLNKLFDYEFILKALNELLVNELNIIKPIILDASPVNYKKNATKYYYSRELYIYLRDLKDVLFNEKIYWNKIITSSKIGMYNKEIIDRIILFQYNLSAIRLLIYQKEYIKSFLNYGNSSNLEDILFDLGSKIRVRYAYLKNKRINKENIIDENKFSSYFINDSFTEFYKYKSLKEEYSHILNLEYLSGVDPSMRICNIKASKNIDNIIDNLDIDSNIKNSLYYINNFYKMYYMFANYYSLEIMLLDPLKIYNSFLKLLREYFTENCNSDELDRLFDATNCLSVKERVYYGLKITNREYKNICNGKINILKL